MAELGRVVHKRLLWIVPAALVLAVAAVALVSRAGHATRISGTIADLEAVHAAVSASGRDVRGLLRLGDGALVSTGTEGLARLRADDGTTIILDRGTRLVAGATSTRLEEGRAFVQGARDARHEVDIGGAVVIVNSARAGFERRSGTASVYCASDELVVRVAGAEQKVRSGETAVVRDGRVNVTPEKAFDDWTGGMAAPWAASGEPRRVLGELWGVTDAGGPGSPLTLRSHDVEVKLSGEVAETTVKTTYFNGGSTQVSGDYRLALPRGAIVSRFACASGSEPLGEGVISTGHASSPGRFPGVAALEWAGEGWVRGHLPAIRSGGTATVLLSYVEWLAPRRDGKTRRVQYRYPLVGEGEPPLVGEFSARVDASRARPLAISAGLGASAQGSTIVLRRSDFRPSADLVVEVELEDYGAPARAYVAPALEDPAGDTVLVRTELPPARADEGVTLAVVVDTSSSVDSALLETAREVVRAIFQGLGPRDRALVLAADQSARAVGQAALGNVDAARRSAVLAALNELSPGGATDLGRALEAAADALPEDAPSGMVVYVGDGWPTLGDSRLADFEARLARRKGGAPRLAAIALGPLANRSLLAALTRGTGPLIEVADASQASPASVRLMVEALRPTLTGVEILFEPHVERVYPRTPRAVVAGDTVWAAARVRERGVTSVTLRWRDANGVHSESRPVIRLDAASVEDVRRRWAAARYEEVMLSGKGKQAAIDVAVRAGLLTPWTSFARTSTRRYAESRLDTRILDLSQITSAGYDAPPSGAGALASIDDERALDDVAGDRELEQAVARAAGRAIDAAGAALRACRDARAQLRPDLEGMLALEVRVDGGGQATTARARAADRTIDDAPLLRCVEVVLRGLRYPASGLTVEVKVSHSLRVALAPVRQARRCSDLASLAMPLRRGVWRERLNGGDVVAVYLDAKHACELASWTDKRAFLELLLEAKPKGDERVTTAQALETLGEADAAEFVRREAVRRASSPAELREIKQILVGDEHYPVTLFERRYSAAGSDGQRLEVVRQFLEVAPHDARLRRRLFALLEAKGEKLALLEEARRVREDPFANAGLLAEVASALRRLGEPAEAARTFGELTERAPADPWARAFLGDRLRDEGLFDDATAAYEALDLLAPGEPAGSVRLALAHAGAGRVDIAQRLLLRVAQTGGRSGDAAFGALAMDLSTLVVADALSRAKDPAETERLKAALLERPLADGRAVLVVRSPGPTLPVQARLVPAAQSGRSERQAVTLTEGFGLYSFDFDPIADRGARLVVSRSKTPAPQRMHETRVDVLSPAGQGRPPRLTTLELELPPDGKAVELEWTGDGLKR